MQPLWHVHMQNLPAKLVFAWPHPGRALFILLNGLYDAKMDHQPVVAIVGQQARAAIGGNYQQEVDLISLFKDVAHEYVHMCSDPHKYGI